MWQERARIRMLLIEKCDADAAQVLRSFSQPDALHPFRLTHLPALQPALEALASRPFDLVVLGLPLQGVGVLEALAKIEAAQESLPVILLSRAREEPLTLKALRCGAQDHLLKGAIRAGEFKRTLLRAIERKRYYRALKEENRRLQELDRMKSSFLAVAAHEIRTPMSAIQLALQLLDDELLGILNRDQKEYVRLLMRNAERLSALLKDVLSASRIESGQLRISPRDCDLNLLVSDVVRLMGIQAVGQGAILSSRLGEGVGHVWCDPESITQVLVNLVNNAILHNPLGTKVVVEAVRLGDQAILSVCDSGKGIPLEEQEEVFRPFSQVRDQTTNSQSGTGLGLTISQGLVQAHGSNLLLESAPGRGTRFYFALPVYEVSSRRFCAPQGTPAISLTSQDPKAVQRGIRLAAGVRGRTQYA